MYQKVLLSFLVTCQPPHPFFSIVEVVLGHLTQAEQRCRKVKNCTEKEASNSSLMIYISLHLKKKFHHF